jgi:hypothetical protein
MRASMLPKKYGWGVHSDAEGRLALVAVGSDSYRRLQEAGRFLKFYEEGLQGYTYLEEPDER